jgi:hypothetical protein
VQCQPNAGTPSANQCKVDSASRFSSEKNIVLSVTINPTSSQVADVAHLSAHLQHSVGSRSTSVRYRTPPAAQPPTRVEKSNLLNCVTGGAGDPSEQCLYAFGPGEQAWTWTDGEQIQVAEDARSSTAT